MLLGLPDQVLYARIAAFQHSLILDRARPAHRVDDPKARREALSKLRRGPWLDQYAAALVEEWGRP